MPEQEETGRKLVFPLQVIYEDNYLAAILKPAGIEVSGNGFKTIARALPQNLEKSPLPDFTLPQPVHRLDYATTGLLLAGKTSASIRALNLLFEKKAVQKVYMAVTIGEMPSEGELQEPVDGKPARTNFKKLASVPSPRFEFLNLIQLEPSTGRRHQIRQHLAGLGHPILGDKDYGQEGLILKGKGMYLHAWQLIFRHPFSHNQLKISAPLPKKYGKIFNFEDIPQL